MQKANPASSVDAPFLTKEEAQGMPEFAEGVDARRAGKSMLDCPYSLPNRTSHGELIRPAEWRVKYENRMQAWFFGLSEDQSQ
ncbi:hypothetical protein R69658_08116 [Paraburkholderia aspalathi]|uniref:Uncharacterized protein n=1 Tax=Paraburkholderia aspalathi TaxID=1324617 RepID=A0ABN7NE22_9BURK|nr:hypothetical protein [Paraburkholderia aspalathi]MBK3824319.1 hypothetical protein [Paraburkholderia aspalathi]MBK3836175.1 hypothetical protein [Paraburkholderia aspalathi]MBK3865940.1 hypothetical protein [Paraburkholderia aspalathi]CAE6870282.1 hypothetical protein R69658_08116 [Paraburkholderia aspalathi]